MPELHVTTVNYIRFPSIVLETLLIAAALLVCLQWSNDAAYILNPSLSVYRRGIHQNNLAQIPFLIYTSQKRNCNVLPPSLPPLQPVSLLSLWAGA